jgi:spermidine synthase
MRDLGPRWLWAAAVSLLFSGAAALTYQVIWVRSLSLVFGSTLGAVATVLAVFMAGLGLGSVLAARFVDPRPTQFLPRLFALLEIAIGVFAVLFPFLMDGITPLYRALYGTAPLPILRAGVASVLLLVPTTLMGASLPVLTALCQRAGGSSVGRSAGILYAANTAGAVLGSLGSALVLLPWVGMRRLTLGAAALNALAAVIVLAASRSAVVAGAPPPNGRASQRTMHGRIALAVSFLSGFAALASEVGWTRSLVLLIGPTTYGFSFVVSAVIFGLSVGSAFGARWSRAPSPKTLLWVQAGAALSSLFVVAILGKLVLPFGRLVHAHADAAGALLSLELVYVVALLFLPSFFFGATFPLAVSVVAGEGQSPAAAAGSTLAWNTAGALSGSLAAGFVLVPTVGAEDTLYAAAATHLVAAALAGALDTRRIWRFATPAAAAALSIGVFLLVPAWDREMLTGGLYKYAPYKDPGELLDFLRQGELLYDREDEVATVTVKRVSTRLSLAIDGKVDATNATDMLTQRMLAHVPLLLHPHPRRVLVIGLGSGVTAGSALTHPIETLEAVEISPGVVEASALFQDVNHAPERDPRFRLVVADGRNHLLLSESTWDVVISEPSNPWMAGVSSLFTREFFVLARTRLAPGGLFCQWAHIYNMAEDDLKTIVGSFTDAFESTALFLLSESDVLLVGARDGFPSIDEEALRFRASRGGVKEDLREVGVLGPPGIRLLFTASTPPLAEWSREAARHTDDRPVLEFEAPRSLHADTSRENRRILEALGKAQALLKTAEPSARDLLARAESLERAESFEWAFEMYERAFETDPGLVEAWQGFSRAAITSGRADLAEERLRSMAETTGRVEPLVALGNLYRSLGKLDDAVLALDGVLSREPDRRDALELAAEVAGDRGENEIMADFARRMLALDPEDAVAASLFAESSLRAGRFDVAARESAAILARSPQEPRALQVHAIANAELRNANLARDSFERLLRIEREDWVQLNNLGKLELSSGNFERAAELFENAVDLNPRNLAGYQGLAEAAQRAGDERGLERARSMLQFLDSPSAR